MDAKSSSGGAPRDASGSPSSTRAFRRAARLRSAAEFQAMFDRGRRLERPAFVLLWSPTPRSRKAGFTVSRQIRGAVHRNRARRRLREAYRNRDVAHPIDTSVVLIARPPALTGSFSVLVRTVDEAMQQLARLRGRDA